MRWGLPHPRTKGIGLIAIIGTIPRNKKDLRGPSVVRWLAILYYMASNIMKTTIEIPDDLLEEAKKVAATEQITLRSLVEEGLRWVLSRRRKRIARFTLRDAGVDGRGVRDGVTEGDWDSIRETIYRGRGS